MNIINKINSFLLRQEKVYLTSEDEVPKGKSVKVGPKGGKYYESNVKPTKSITTSQFPKHNRFARGSGVYTCGSCGKRTRDTGEGANVELCAKCYIEAGEENAHMDGHHKSDRDGPSRDCPICKKLKLV